MIEKNTAQKQTEVSKKYLRILIVCTLTLFAILLFSLVFATFDRVDPWHSANDIHTPFNEETLQKLATDQYFVRYHSASCGGHTAIRGYDPNRELMGCSYIRPKGS
jgi:hypothetical protein